MKKTFEGLIDTSIVADPQLNASITPLQPNSSSDGSWSETFPLLSIKKDPWYISLISIVSASLLGIMLNILDAVSYGLIIFPVMSMPDIFGSIFLKDGITMFFVSTILSQIVYTFGGSKFKGGNGSCMIEIIPFLHSMIRTIAETNSNHDTIISTTLFCFAISSILTGFVFLLIGYFRWGKVCNYFPRPFLIGTIGGIGFFLFQTGIEVASGMPWSWSFEFGKSLLEKYPIIIACLFSSLFFRIMHNFNQHPLLLPSYLVTITGLFYLILFVAGTSVEDARNAGWILKITTQEEHRPWYYLWTHIHVDHVDWLAIFHTLPTMLTLILFSVLHVPINLPALAISTNHPKINMNRELIGHGISNMLSGFAFSIQNYLVYCNSVLIIRIGGNSRMIGILMIIGTTLFMATTQNLLAYLPIVTISTLIFQLGFDLISESIYTSFSMMPISEYLQILLITVIMAIFGFTYGILIGIVICVFGFLFRFSKLPVIRNLRDLKRNPNTYLLPKQITIKLQGYIFFGNMVQVSDLVESFIHRYSMEGSFCSDSYGLGITIASPPRSPAQKAQTFPTKLIIPSSPSPGPTSATRRISLHHPGIIFSPHEACIILDFENVTGMDYSFTTCLQDLETQCDTQKIKLCLYGK